MLHLGIDLGTGSVKVLALSPGAEEKTVSAPYPVLTPQPGFAETPVIEWLDAVRNALAQLGTLPSEVTIGFSGQMHGVVPCAEGDAIYPAILWNDTRARYLLPEVDVSESTIKKHLMNQPSSGMALFIILWLKKYRRDIYDRTEYFLQPKDFIRYYLTGEAATDPSDGGGTLLYDFQDGCWYRDLLEKHGLDIDKLPPIRNSFTLTAPILPERAAELGLPKYSILRIGGADTACALFGNGISDESMLQLSIGTGAQIVRYARSLPPYIPGLNTFPAVDGGWYTMAAHLNGGSFLEWLRKILGFSWEEVYARLEAHSLEEWLREMQDLTFLPYINGERTPIMNADITGNLSGLKANHTRDHIILSALMGTLFAIRSGLDAILREDPGDIPLLVTGGSFSYAWWTRLVSTMLKRPLTISPRLNASVWGAALIGSGKDSDLYKNHAVPPLGGLYYPDEHVCSIIDDMYGHFQALAGL